jgi:hypothetical protein
MFSIALTAHLRRKHRQAINPQRWRTVARSAGILPAILDDAAARKNAGPSRLRVNKMPALRELRGIGRVPLHRNLR